VLSIDVQWDELASPFCVGEEKYINFWKATTLMTEARHVDSPKVLWSTNLSLIKRGLTTVGGVSTLSRLAGRQLGSFAG
jgi:hypothetical protein